MTHQRSHRVLGTLLLILLVGVLSVANTGTSRAAVVERRPDLKMHKPSGFYIQNTATQKRLRFTTVMTNLGPGRFDVRASRPSTSYSRMSLKQRIYRSDGTYRSISIPTSDSYAFYAGDGHDHWHVYRLQQFTIHRVHADGTYSGVLGRGAKTGFCFYDNTKVNLTLRYAPLSPSYTSCGTASSTKVRMGLSVGWGDTYGARLAYQWIQINGLRDGVYRVRVTADSGNRFLESVETNNAAAVSIRITGNTVVRLS
jgi:hypothetical protein